MVECYPALWLFHWFSIGDLTQNKPVPVFSRECGEIGCSLVERAWNSLGVEKLWWKGQLPGILIPWERKPV